MNFHNTFNSTKHPAKGAFLYASLLYGIENMSAFLTLIRLVKNNAEVLILTVLLRVQAILVKNVIQSTLEFQLIA